MGTLDRKVAIITGSAGGQGAAEAELFVRQGAKVVIADIQEKGQELADKLGKENAIFVRLDVSDKENWESAVEETRKTFGAPSVLINNAAVFRPKPLVDTDAADMELHFRINQLGPFLGIQAVLPGMRELGGGSIVNIVSISGIRYLPDQFAYAVSKWGARGLSGLAAAELGKEKIRVNSVYPGLIDTPMLAGNTAEMNEYLASITPIGRMGQPEDVAELVAYLASDSSSFVTGGEFSIDGGARLRL